MRTVGADEIESVLDYRSLIDTIRAAFAGTVRAPTRHHHYIARPGGADATLILMPAWQETDGFLGVKMVSVFPDNALRQKSSVQATYVLMDGNTGEPLATLDGRLLTLWRTAATSALAARALARPDATRLAMIGAGELAPRLIAAHVAVLPIREVTIWNRTGETARALAARLDRPGLRVRASDDREAIIRHADVISVATLSRQPVVQGDWLKPGTHVDLVGSYTPYMREADDAAIRRARVFVDTRAGMQESGDIAVPLATGVLTEAAIVGDLFEIARAAGPLRNSPEEITLFKSVGHAIEDFAAAVHVWRRLA